MSNPQSWNRYSYVQNRPINFNDPSGHWANETDDPVKERLNLARKHAEERAKLKKKHEPSEPRCKGKHCDTFGQILTGTALGLDIVGAGLSYLEATIATDAYVTAVGACVASKFAGCGAAFKLAFAADVAAASVFAFYENGVGMLSLGVTAVNDIWIGGNTGFDADIGMYIGKDTVVAGRNTLAGFIPESYSDFAVSLSQVKYDMDRATGIKSGGYVPMFDPEIKYNMMLPALSKDFLKQTFLQDWW